MRIWPAPSSSGTTPADEAIVQIEGLLEEVSDRGVEASMLLKLAGLHAMEGRFELARSLYERSKAIRTEMGQEIQLAGLSMFAEEVGLLPGDVDWAERELRAGYEALERMGEKGIRSTIAGSSPTPSINKGATTRRRTLPKPACRLQARTMSLLRSGTCRTAQLLAIQGLHQQAGARRPVRQWR